MYGELISRRMQILSYTGRTAFSINGTGKTGDPNTKKKIELNPTYILICLYQISPLWGQGSMLKMRQKDCKSQRELMSPGKQHLSDTAGVTTCKLTETVTAGTRPTQIRARQNPSTEKGK